MYIMVDSALHNASIQRWQVCGVLVFWNILFYIKVVSIKLRIEIVTANRNID